jgi:hypothetical protein
LKCGQRAWVYDGIGESGFQRMKIDKDIENVLNTDWLLDKLNRIDKMNEEERKEILEQLRVEADRVLEKIDEERALWIRLKSMLLLFHQKIENYSIST